MGKLGYDFFLSPEALTSDRTEPEVVDQPKLSKTLAIIQARMGSRRLPGKVLSKIYKDKTVLEFMLSRVMNSKLIDDIIVATTTRSEDNQIKQLVDSKFFRKVGVYQGSVNNVLSRYYYLATDYLASHPYIAPANLKVVRLTADCPLIDPILIDRMLLQPTVFVSNATIDRSYPIGMDVEIMTYPTLRELFFRSYTKEEVEHVTLLIYELMYELWKLYCERRKPKDDFDQDDDTLRSQYEISLVNSYSSLVTHMAFHLRDFKGAIDYSAVKYKWAIDTQEDLDHVRKLVEIVYPKDERFTFHDLLCAENEIKNSI